MKWHKRLALPTAATGISKFSTLEGCYLRILPGIIGRKAASAWLFLPSPATASASGAGDAASAAAATLSQLGGLLQEPSSAKGQQEDEEEEEEEE